MRIKNNKRKKDSIERKRRPVEDKKEDNEYDLTDPFIDDSDVEYMSDDYEFYKKRKLKEWSDGLSQVEIRKYTSIRNEMISTMNEMTVKEIDIIKSNLPMTEKSKLLLKFQILQNIPEDCQEWLDLNDSIYSKLKKNILPADDEKKLNDIKRIMQDDDQMLSLEQRILRSNFNMQTKTAIYRKYMSLISTSESDENYVKLHEWINIALRLPSESIDIIRESNPHELINRVYSILNNKIYGQINVKERVLEILAKMCMESRSTNKCIAIVGPPGVGKTMLARTLAEAFGTSFYQVSLGGIRDASILKGHGYTYIGAKPGIIVDALVHMRHTNGILYFDELDKLNDTNSGDGEINDQVSSALLEILDSTQNHDFRDMYMPEIPLDLSKLTFVLSFNDMSKINKILLDRLDVIQMTGYTFVEKIKIASDYIVPKIMSDFGFTKKDVIFNNNVLSYIVKISDGGDNQLSGVRNLERVLNRIIEKINLLKMIKNNTINLSYNINTNVSINLTEKTVNELLDIKKH